MVPRGARSCRAGESVPAHDLAQRGVIGRSAGCGLEDGRDLAEVVRAEDARGSRPQAPWHWRRWCFRTGARRRAGLLGELERLDYLERQPDPDDQRSKRILLTPRGTAAIHTIREAVDDLETTWAQQLGPEHFEQLRTLLLQLNQQA